MFALTRIPLTDLSCVANGDVRRPQQTCWACIHPVLLGALDRPPSQVQDREVNGTDPIPHSVLSTVGGGPVRE